MIGQDSIQQIIRQIRNGASLDFDEESQFLNILEQYECWGCYTLILARRLKRKNITDYIRLIRCYIERLEDLESAKSCMCTLIEDLGVSARDLRDIILSQVVPQNEFAMEAEFLEAALTVYSAKRDIIVCLERLALIYDKKLFKEPKLKETYDRLISVEPKNIKALKFFKLIYSESQDWEEVVKILRTLMDVTSYLQERYRLAQELASLYLFQMNEPKKALSTIDEFCVGSPLDLSNLRFDCFERLNDMVGCSRVLIEALKTTTSDRDRSRIMFLLGQVQERSEDLTAAKSSYSEASLLDNLFLEPTERLVQLAIEAKNWSEISSVLNSLKAKIPDRELSDQVQQAINRLKQGMDTDRATVS